MLFFNLLLYLSVSSRGNVCLGPTLTSTPLKSLLTEEGMSRSLGFMSSTMERPFFRPALGLRSMAGLLEFQSG